MVEVHGWQTSQEITAIHKSMIPENFILFESGYTEQVEANPSSALLRRLA